MRPFHGVSPYRLEMGAKLSSDDVRDLYAFWGDKPACAIAPTGSNTTVVNLASVEYAKAVLPHLAGDATTVTCLFGEGVRNGKPIQRSTASKKARGSMVRWMEKQARGCQAGSPRSTLAIVTFPSFQIKTLWFFLNEQT